jgi:hypothetical protein
MAFSETLKLLLDQGIAASKDLAGKAGAKAQELGEKGVLKLEIAQLQSKLRQATGKLGVEAYKAFVEYGEPILKAEDESVKGILTEIADTKALIEKKENDYKNA